MNLTTVFERFLRGATTGATSVRRMIFGAASALALASPAVANGVTPYSEDATSYDYRAPPPVVVEEQAPVVVVRPPVVVAPPPVV